MNKLLTQGELYVLLADANLYSEPFLNAPIVGRVGQGAIVMFIERSPGVRHALFHDRSWKMIKVVVEDVVGYLGCVHVGSHKFRVDKWFSKAV